MSPLPQTIDEVIARMDAIIAESTAGASRLGYFAALYRMVTRQVKANIEAGSFDNPEMMGRLAVTFAGRYFAAYEQYQSGQAPTAPWLVAFEASKKRYPIILQHLLLGMNAHINLDLAIASAETSPGVDILSLKADFMQINAILASQVPIVLKALGTASPLIGLVSLFYRRTEMKVTHFSMELARNYSWLLAEDLATADTSTASKRIAKTILDVKDLALHLLHSGILVKLLIFVVALAESNDVRKNIEVLSQAS